MRHVLYLTGAVALLVAPAQAATTEGYMRAGGVGMVQCAQFTNVVAEARPDGLSSPMGINKIQPFFAYAMGFYTSYNSSAAGVYDVLAGIRGDQMVATGITILDTWCADHPLKEFDDAVIGILPILLEGATMGTAP